MRFICSQGCVVEGTKQNPPPRICEEHGTPFVYEKEMKRTPLRSVSEAKAAQTGRRGSTLKQGRGFSVTKAQRDKILGLPCIGCGREASEYVAIDPAHLWPRGRGGCDDVLCVGPLCRSVDHSCHTLFDNGELDLLPALIDRGYWPEIAHMVSHEVSPTQVLERLTGQRWQPVEELAA